MRLQILAIFMSSQIHEYCLYITNKDSDRSISFILLFYQVIIVTSSLMKDMNSKTDMYRANAIRVLCRITDGTLLTQIERYLKQAIVDKNPVVASAALVSGIHILQVLLKSIGNSLSHIPHVLPAYFMSPLIRQIPRL